MESIGMATLEIFTSDCSTEGGEFNFPEDIEGFFRVWTNKYLSGRHPNSSFLEQLFAN